MNTNDSASGLRKPYFVIALLLTLILALALRMHDIHARPLHSDEGGNFHFIEEIRTLGIYRYSHENFHGPTYFWLSRYFVDIFGEDPFGFRSVSIFAGACLPLLLLRLPGALALNGLFVLIAGLLFAVSPSLVFYSRYAIHEMVFVFFCMGMALELFLLNQTRRLSHLYAAAIFLALAIGTKETFILTLAALGASLLLLKDLPGFIRFLVQESRHLAQASLCGVIALFFIFSSGFRHTPGIREMFLAVPQWIGRGTKSDPGHFKPMLHYARDMFFATEGYLLGGYFAMLLLAVLLAAAVPLRKIPGVLKDFQLPLYLFSWSLLVLIAYSLVPYKTPWLVINITAPATLNLAWLLAKLISLKNWPRVLGIVLTLIITVCGLGSTFYYNYTTPPLPIFSKESKPFGPENPFSYVQTSSGMIDMIDDIREYWQEHPEAKVLVGVPTYWPIPYYLRDVPDQLGYFVPKDVDEYIDEYAIIIIDNRKKWEKEGWEKKYYRLSDVQEAHIFLNKKKA